MVGKVEPARVGPATARAGTAPADRARNLVRTVPDRFVALPEADPAHTKVRWRKLELPAQRQAVKLIPADDPAAAGKELVRLLREEAKVI